MDTSVVSAPQPGLRGNYSAAGADYVVEQEWGRYSLAQHTLWRKLYQRQSALAHQHACDQFIAALPNLNAGDAIPRFADINERLLDATGWQIVGVPGLIPDREFFTHLSERRFPVTVWLREPSEIDYIVEPDLFHDLYGHVPLLFDPIYAAHLQAYGIGGLKALKLDSLKYIARLYWYTIEFGLMRTPRGLKAYGAGLLSSGGELPYCVENDVPQRLMLNVARAMQTDYRIDDFQDVYFVVDSFEQLLQDTAPDFEPHYAKLKRLPTLRPMDLTARDVVI